MKLQAALDAGASWSGRERNRVYLNLGDTRFAQVSACSGLDFIDDARGVGLVDWDQDGDLDMWISNCTGPRVRLMRNDTPNDNRFVAIQLVGTKCNRDAIGTRVELYFDAASTPSRIKTLRAGEGFIAQSSKELHFGLGAADRIARLVVRWPDGIVEDFSDLGVNARYRIVQGRNELQRWIPPERTVDLAVSSLEDPGAQDQARIVLPHRRNLGWLSYRRLDGAETTIGKQMSRPVLINLWATSCTTCVKELSEFAVHTDAIRAAGIDVLAIEISASTDAEKQTKAAQELLEKVDFRFPAGTMDRATLRKLTKQLKSSLAVHSASVIPVSLLLDDKHRLIAVYRGPLGVEALIEDARLVTLDDDSLAALAEPFAGRWHFHPVED